HQVYTPSRERGKVLGPFLAFPKMFEILSEVTKLCRQNDMAQFTNTGSQEIVVSTPEPVWNCTEAARFLRLHPKTVKRMARRGQIPGCRLGRRWYFRPSDLDAMLRTSVSSSLKANRVAPQLSSNSKRRG